MNPKLFIAVLMLPIAATAQTFDFDMSKPQPTYTSETGYGYDFQTMPATKGKTASPFYFSVNVPDGNYKVRVVLGSKKRAAETTVRAENRRLMLENVVTKKKQAITCEFIVNKRSPIIDSSMRVKVKEREKDYLTWDEKLTLEFNGAAPAVESIHIERTDGVPTIFLCGNSTVVDQPREPWASWGQMITRWFGPEVSISNHAESGLTARTFLASNRLEKILSTLKPGDYVICEFGHNDEKEKRPGDGAWYHYVYNLKIFVDKVRAKGGEVIFCTPTQRRAFNQDGQTLINTHGDFPAAMLSVAQRENVQVIDLNYMTKVLFETMGSEGSKHLLVHYPANTFPGQDKELADNTHFNPFGAYQVAKCVVMGLKQINFPLLKYLRPDWHDFSPSRPDDWETFKWAPAQTFEAVKPDGN